MVAKPGTGAAHMWACILTAVNEIMQKFREREGTATNAMFSCFNSECIGKNTPGAAKLLWFKFNLVVTKKTVSFFERAPNSMIT